MQLHTCYLLACGIYRCYALSVTYRRHHPHGCHRGTYIHSIGCEMNGKLFRNHLKCNPSGNPFTVRLSMRARFLAQVPGKCAFTAKTTSRANTFLCLPVRMTARCTGCQRRIGRNNNISNEILTYEGVRKTQYDFFGKLRSIKWNKNISSTYRKRKIWYFFLITP